MSARFYLRSKSGSKDNTVLGATGMRVVTVYEDLVDLTGDFIKAVLLRYLIQATSNLPVDDWKNFVNEEMLRAGRRDIFGHPREHGWINLPAEVLSTETLLRFRHPNSVVQHMSRMAKSGLIWMDRVKGEVRRPWKYRLNLPCIASRLYRMGYNLRVHWTRELPFFYEDIENTAESAISGGSISRSEVGADPASVSEVGAIRASLSEVDVVPASVSEVEIKPGSESEIGHRPGSLSEVGYRRRHGEPPASDFDRADIITASLRSRLVTDDNMKEALDILERLEAAGPPEADKNELIAQLRANEIAEVVFGGTLDTTERAQLINLLVKYGYRAVKRAVIYYLHARQQDLGIIRPMRYIETLVAQGSKQGKA